MIAYLNHELAQCSWFFLYKKAWIQVITRIHAFSFIVLFVDLNNVFYKAMQSNRT